MKNKKLLIKKSFELVSEIGWENFNLKLLAEKNKFELDDIKTIFKTKSSVLKEFSIMIDEEVVNSINQNDFIDNPVKDNLFEIIMMRFEKLKPYKNGIVKILNSAKKNPLILKKVSRQLFSSLDFFLEVSNAKDNFLFDKFKLSALFVIYSYVFNIWLKDDSDEMSKTMAELDSLLSKSEIIVKKLINTRNFRFF